MKSLKNLGAFACVLIAAAVFCLVVGVGFAVYGVLYEGDNKITLAAYLVSVAAFVAAVCFGAPAWVVHKFREHITKLLEPRCGQGAPGSGDTFTQSSALKLGLQHRCELEIAAMSALAHSIASSCRNPDELGKKLRKGIDELVGGMGHAYAVQSAFSAMQGATIASAVMSSSGFGSTGAPQTYGEALDVIRAIHDALLDFRHPEFDLIKPGCEGEFDARVKAVLAISAPVIKADRAT